MLFCCDKVEIFERVSKFSEIFTFWRVIKEFWLFNYFLRHESSKGFLSILNYSLISWSEIEFKGVKWVLLSSLRHPSLPRKLTLLIFSKGLFLLIDRLLTSWINFLWKMFFGRVKLSFWDFSDFSVIYRFICLNRELLWLRYLQDFWF